MKMSVYLQTATSHRGQRESRAIGQKLSCDDNYQYIRWLTRTIFFLRRWPRVWQPENSIKSHMVSYCSVIKFSNLFKIFQKHYRTSYGLKIPHFYYKEAIIYFILGLKADHKITMSLLPILIHVCVISLILKS